MFYPIFVAIDTANRALYVCGNIMLLQAMYYKTWNGYLDV